jgi:hypothetical protein
VSTARIALLVGMLGAFNRQGLAAQGVVRGRVVEATNGQTVVGASVELRGVGGSFAVLSDTNGRYAFGALSAAMYELRVSHATHAPRTLWIVVGGREDISVEVVLVRIIPDQLAPKAVPLERIFVRASAVPYAHTADTNRSRADWMDRAPWRTLVGTANLAAMMPFGSLAESGLLSPIARDQPGLRLSPAAHALLVWGPGDEHGQVRVDGIPLDAPLHVAGLLAPIDDDLLASTTLRTAGASPRYDGSSAFILDFATRPPRPAFRTWGEFDPVAARFGVALPVADGALWVNARHVNSTLTGWLIGRPFGYSYSDALARGELPVVGGTLSSTSIATSESVNIPRDQGVDEAKWRNLAGALSWARATGADEFSVRLTVGRGTVNLPVLSIAAGQSTTAVERAVITVDDIHKGPQWSEAHGAEISVLRLTERTEGSVTDDGPIASSTPASSTPAARALCATPFACWATTAREASVFGEVSRDLLRRKSLSGGIRLNATDNGVGVTTHLLPRASLTSAVGRNVVLGTSIGWYSQIAASRGETASPTLKPHQSMQAEVGAAWRDGTGAAAAVASLTRRRAGAGEHPTIAQGMDLSYQHGTPRATGALAYSATRAAGRRSASGTQQTIVGRFTTSARAVRVGLTLTYATGLPYTSVVLERPALIQLFGSAADSVAEAPMHTLLRLDVALRREMNVSIAGRSLTVEPNVTVRNMLGGINAPFYYRSPADGGSIRGLAAIPFSASVGLRWDGGAQRASAR